MLVRVLGAGAGGGFPQWNCNCRNCKAVRAGKPGFTARTQSSLAVSRDGRHWVLLNASPDLRHQMSQCAAMQPSPDDGLRSSPVKAAVVTNGDVDHLTGLINLREVQPFSVYATSRVLGVMNANSVFNILTSDAVPRIALEPGVKTRLSGDNTDLGLDVEAFEVPGKIALYLEDVSQGPGLGTQAGDTIGLKVSDPADGSSFFYIPGCAAVDAPLAGRLQGATHVFFDGTLYDDEEMIRQGLMQKTGPRMGHISMSGPGGSIAAFEKLGVGRKVFVHINNSNPVLDENSLERKAVEAAGWEVGFDGMEIQIGGNRMNEFVTKFEGVRPPWSKEEFEAQLRAVGPERYHDLHPFHKLLHGGKLSKGQVAAWALNRYCYQECIPRKDAAFMSRVHDRELRREWIHRILDHDGNLPEEQGGIERWLKLTDCLGLDRELVTSMRAALPATRFACEAYVRFVVEQPLVAAAASSLTEMFAPNIHRERISGMLANYSFVNDEVMAYFKRRLSQAPRDTHFTVDFVKDNAHTREEQEACVNAIRFKCDMLWAQLDALYNAYVNGHIPPGAYRPEGM